MSKLLNYFKILIKFATGNKQSKLIRAKKSNNPKKKILIPTSAGGLQSILAFESLVGNILQHEGNQVDFLLCDEILPGCIMSTIFNIGNIEFEKYGSKKICSYCFQRSNKYLKKYNLNVIRLSELVDKEVLNKYDEKIFLNNSFQDLKNFRLNGVNLGEHANSGCIRYLTTTDFNKFLNYKKIFIKYLKSSILTQIACEKLFSKKNYDHVFINHGIYVPQGVIIDTAKVNNLKVSTWCFAYKKNSVWVSPNDTYHRELINEDEVKWNNFDFTKEIENKIDEYLKSRQTGQNDWEFYFDNPNFNIDKYFQKRQIDPQKPIITLATNMLWDAQVYFPTNFFKDMLEWLYFTIDYFIKRDDLQLVIRIHPAEANKTKKSIQRLEENLKEKYPDLPKNIFVVTPEDSVSTYAILEKSNCLLVYASKIAVEAAAMGVPTIVAGECFLKNKKISIDVKTKTEYLNILDNLPFLKNFITKEKLDRAKKYAYHFWFRRTIPIKSFYEKKNKNPFVGIKENYLELYKNKQDKGLNMIINSIINNKDFIYKDEKYN